jgi:hypothetical protein
MLSLLPILSQLKPNPLARGSNQPAAHCHVRGRCRRDRWFGVFRAVPRPPILRISPIARSGTALSHANDMALREIEPRLFVLCFQTDVAV